MDRGFKIYTVRKTKNGRDTIVSGDLQYIKEYFSYTLECGASWNRKINRYPKTIKSFISNLQKSYEEVEASCYERTYVKNITGEK
tara:strand:+ start:298 stop:552 length:255 start_codon:yes stop_codon:yes gene_type:complete